jgi:NIMA (never in mitosis gene a)-related kinase 2
MLSQNSNDRPTVDELMSLPQLSLRIREKKLHEAMGKLRRKEEELSAREAKINDRENAVQQREAMINERETALNDLIAKAQDFAMMAY